MENKMTKAVSTRADMIVNRAKNWDTAMTVYEFAGLLYGDLYGDHVECHGDYEGILAVCGLDRAPQIAIAHVMAMQVHSKDVYKCAIEICQCIIQCTDMYYSTVLGVVEYAFDYPIECAEDIAAVFLLNKEMNLSNHSVCGALLYHYDLVVTQHCNLPTGKMPRKYAAQMLKQKAHDTINALYKECPPLAWEREMAENR
jgi:hypothetical protein